MASFCDNPDDFPKPQIADTAVEMAKGLVGSAFPGASALAALIQTSHSRRVTAFHRRTAERVRVLEKTSTSTLLQQALEGNEDAKEEILSTYATIARLLQEAMDDEKREALSSAMASSLLWPIDAENIERRYFLRCLDQFEAIHLNLLARARHGVVEVRDLATASGPLGENANVAWKELNSRGMVNTDSVGGMMTASGAAADRTTPLGARFLRFIGRED